MSADKLDEAIDRAIARITSGLAPMRIPADPDSDPDLVLARCKVARQEDRDEIERLRAERSQANLATIRQRERAEAAEAKLTVVEEASLRMQDESDVLRAKLAEVQAVIEANPHHRECLKILATERAKNEKLVEALEAIVKHTPRQGFGQAADMRGIASEALAAAKASEEKG